MATQRNRNLSRDFYSSPDHHDFTMVCDFGDSPNCEGEQEFEDTTFFEMLKKAKGFGWQISKHHAGFMHRCPSCVAHAKERAMDEFRARYSEDDHE